MNTTVATALSDSLYQKILAIAKDSVAIQPSNVEFFSPQSVIPVARPGEKTPRIDDTANINGVDGYKINRLIREIETTKKKLLIMTGGFLVENLNFEKNVSVPAGYDGRNSFVAFHMANDILPHDGSDTRPLRIWNTRNRDSIVFSVENGIDIDAETKRGLVYAILLWRDI